MANSNNNDKYKSIHKGHRSRVKEKFLKYGFEPFTDFEVLEYLLYYAIPYKDTNPIAHELIEKFGSLRGVLDAEYYDLAEVKGMGDYSAALVVLFRELNKYMSTKYDDGILLDTSYKMGKFCLNYFKSHVEENFICLSLDGNDRLTCVDVVSRGTENETAFYLRKLMKIVIKNRTNCIILSHNHPGSVAMPSVQDAVITESAGNFLKTIGVTVKDHVICTRESFTCMSDAGTISF